jgi:hypothetical protein
MIDTCWRGPPFSRLHGGPAQRPQLLVRNFLLVIARQELEGGDQGYSEVRRGRRRQTGIAVDLTAMPGASPRSRRNSAGRHDTLAARDTAARTETRPLGGRSTRSLTIGHR